MGGCPGQDQVTGDQLSIFKNTFAAQPWREKLCAHVCFGLLVFKSFLGMVNGHLGDNKQVLETKGGNGELR